MLFEKSVVKIIIFIMIVQTTLQIAGIVFNKTEALENNIRKPRSDDFGKNLKPLTEELLVFNNTKNARENEKLKRNDLFLCPPCKPCFCCDVETENLNHTRNWERKNKKLNKKLYFFHPEECHCSKCPICKVEDCPEKV